VNREIISRDMVLPQNKIMLVPPKIGWPYDMPVQMETLPNVQEKLQSPAYQPPRSGVIYVPDEDSSEAEPERNLSTSERTLPTACE
jgi:hypothetical protein